ncbi:DUF2934 domain-containing protein [Pseudomonas sp. UL073]|uniref:DUF2934 domain-containing protein n=1 Tax=Zestomonas insulae TaxID=2809017 RepID=A0ABS2IFZ7_9GAMM|nr:DUF2934 domain-containing protein [Pseudomonas insulae]MBM7061892.1 DUF2934 domain-containing protein [Pseudomonas insulae]
MTSLEHRTRELAYQIWESEGRPDGQSERHWAMARKLAEAEAAAAGVAPDEPAATPRPKRVSKPRAVPPPEAAGEETKPRAVRTTSKKPKA